jgi:hypothetical protein
MQTKQKQEMNTNQTTDTQKQREVNTAAAVLGRAKAGSLESGHRCSLILK